MASETGSWPLLDERAPFATAAHGRGRGRKPSRPLWLLTGLAFLCGGLVSAAAFSIGWRHQAQRNTAAQTALAAAAARAHRLEQRLGALRTSLGRARGAAARDRASATAAAVSEQALVRAAASVAEEATVSGGSGDAVSSSAGSLATAATRISSELKTLDTYLTTTPTGQLDPGYIASQTAYLARQLARLQGNAGALGSSVASLETTLRKLGRDANGLKNR
jgi:prefoldin subunit 5